MEAVELINAETVPASEVYKEMSYTALCRLAGVGYLIAPVSAKARATLKNMGTLNPILYLASGKSSGHNVCPCSKWCEDSCLNESGLAKIDILSGNLTIQQARIKRTQLFFDDRELFMEILIREVKAFIQLAVTMGVKLCVRMNGTSDINIREFIYEGKPIVEVFPDVQFYDYTKVPGYLDNVGRWKNYDLTFSYDGHNGNIALQYLQRGGKVAVVFSDHAHPRTMWGYPVECGDNDDCRFAMKPGTVVGLTYHPVASDYENGHFKGVPDIDFIVRPERVVQHDEPQTNADYKI